MAFQAERRFWELDHQIYGGMSWTSRDSTQVWYPSAGLHRRKGILVGAYIWSDELGNAFAAKPLAQRAGTRWTTASASIRGYGRDLGQGVAWHGRNIPFSAGRLG